jgi:hypothetical protein
MTYQGKWYVIIDEDYLPRFFGLFLTVSTTVVAGRLLASVNVMNRPVFASLARLAIIYLQKLRVASHYLTTLLTFMQQWFLVQALCRVMLRASNRKAILFHSMYTGEL